MNLALLIAIPFAYIVAEMIITTFFNRKIKYVSEGKFTQASRMGALATFLFLGSVVLSTLIADMAGLGKVGIYTYPIVTSAAMAIGNFIAT